MSSRKKPELIEDKFNGAMVYQYSSAQLFERMQREKSAAEFEQSQHVFEYLRNRHAQAVDRRKRYETELRNIFGLSTEAIH